MRRGPLQFTLAIVFLSMASAAGAASANPTVKPTRENVRYGPHERNVLSFWKAKSDQPTPVVIYIHGGGWLRGGLRSTVHLYPFLARRVSVVAITYRLAPKHLVPAPLLDAARAVQFVRHRAKEWGLDKQRVALIGSSAGACTSLWLALHDDLADPDNADPVLRESTKPTCALSNAGQTFIDIKLVREVVGDKAASHGMIWRTVGAKSATGATVNYEKFAKLYREYSPLTHLDKDDPPVLLYYKTGGDNIHSSRFGDRLIENAKKLNARVYMYAPENSVPPPQRYKGRWEFIYKQLLKPCTY